MGDLEKGEREVSRRCPSITEEVIELNFGWIGLALTLVKAYSREVIDAKISETPSRM